MPNSAAGSNLRHRGLVWGITVPETQVKKKPATDLVTGLDNFRLLEIPAEEEIEIEIFADRMEIGPLGEIES